MRTTIITLFRLFITSLVAFVIVAGIECLTGHANEDMPLWATVWALGTVGLAPVAMGLAVWDMWRMEKRR